MRSLSVEFDAPGSGPFARRRTLRALDGVSFDLIRGETLGVVGESGCGKTTLARAILQLTPASAGRVLLHGEDLSKLGRFALRQRRRAMQLVFQDPLASLSPRMTIGEIIAEPLRAHAEGRDTGARKARVVAMMDRVGLLPGLYDRYPHELSGGQCQRVGIARALVLEPDLVVCDEPVSALDLSVRAQIVNLLMDLQHEMGLALLFIAHDLSVVRQVSHRVLVMYLGRIMETAERDALFAAPRHPYTRALLDSVPVPDPTLARARTVRTLPGDPPSPLDPPSGCVFRTRCPHAQPLCAERVPVLRQVGGSLVACHFAEDI
ncbi:MAG: ATP-binding cassette domain-containing protein [Xanthomonadaceae bacterium]|nr:ATP-binding cassette domain-containing protein [Xanthomonadaceae bacterium]